MVSILMTPRPRNLLALSATITSVLAMAVACSSDESGSSDTGTPTSGTPTASTTASTTGGSTTSNTVSSSVTSSTTSASTTVTNTTATATVAGPSTTTSTSTATTGTSTATSTGTETSTGAGGTSTGAGGATGAGGTSTTGGSTEFTLTSPAYADDGVCSNDAPDTCELIPSENSSFVGNENPELNWTAGPDGTLGYVLIFHDLSNGFGHWALWTIPGDTLSLPAAIADDRNITTPFEAEQVNLGQGDGYFGPGSCSNVYEFKIYAINVESFTPESAMSPDTIQDELEESDIVLDTATLRGRANPDDC